MRFKQWLEVARGRSGDWADKPDPLRSGLHPDSLTVLAWVRQDHEVPIKAILKRPQPDSMKAKMLARTLKILLGALHGNEFDEFDEDQQYWRKRLEDYAQENQRPEVKMENVEWDKIANILVK